MAQSKMMVRKVSLVTPVGPRASPLTIAQPVPSGIIVVQSPGVASHRLRDGSDYGATEIILQ